ncbi:MAG TPA: hypothetical protein VN903_06780 [Polyangia bacterium]|jgi:hypothetical protein|nr:hypothetical protein [Polyangia bacterium]
MREGRCGWLSLSLSVIAAVQVSLIPVSKAQDAPAPSEPQVNDQGNNVAPPQPLFPGPSGPPAAPVLGPVVNIRGDSRARLQLMYEQEKWTDVCKAPCNKPVNAQGTYRIGGGTIRASDAFTLPRPSGQVVIDTQVGSTIKHWVGVALIIGGVVDAAAGIAYYSAADDLASRNSSGSTLADKGYWQTAGIVTIVIGVILVGVGIPLSMSSTSVVIH